MLDFLKKNENTAGTFESTLNNTGGGGSIIAVLSNKKTSLNIVNVPATIGRNGSEADVYFYHDSLSGVHCRLDCENRQFTLTDLGSAFGTQVNDVKLEANVPHPVDSGDRLVIGKVKFDLKINYDEIGRREREAMPSADAEPQQRTYTVQAREVNEFEYEEHEVIFVSCGLEPQKKKATYTQEIQAQAIQDAIRYAAMADASAGDENELLTQAVIEAGPAAAPEPAPEPEPEPVQRMGLLLTRTDDGTGSVEEIVVDHFPFRIGRKREINDYAIRLEGISREHLSISEHEGVYYITDLNSTNGVRVSGVRIPPGSEYRIAPGDTIKLSNRVYTINEVEL